MKPATQSYRVLLADDQPDIRDALRLLLKREGYETHGVASPADALAAIESREFDAVLMDIVEQSPRPPPIGMIDRQSFLGHSAVARSAFILAALAGLWLAIALVVGWVG